VSKALEEYQALSCAADLVKPDPLNQIVTSLSSKITGGVSK